MKIFKNEIDLKFIKQQIAEQIGVTIDVTSTDRSFTNVSDLREANERSICFYESERYIDDFRASNAGLILVPKVIDCKPKENQVLLTVDKPYFLFMWLVSRWLELDNQASEKSISPLASIHPSAKIGQNVNIAPYVVIEEGVEIGDNTCIGSHTVILTGSKIGHSCKVYPNVVIYHDCKIGDKAIIHSGAVIGADGFGFLPLNGVQIKVPQVGNVVIEDDVEIGANTCIDRSTIGTTLIKTNAKIDNLVQIGHNSRVDEHSVLCSQVGLAGSTHIGKSVYLAGQVGVAGHLKIDDDTLVGAQSGVPASLPTGKYFGSPAISAFEQKKIVGSLKDLPSVVRFVKKMMKEEA